MFGRSRSWVGGGHGKAARSIHSLDHLKYMYHVLTKNTTVTDHNRNLLVETIRSITEILIWGDQNDSSVFDFFLEKNMFVFFLNILRQKSGRYVCVQLLQTLNILFENISHETSLYYLLSNNYVNSIIVHKFDFSDEEIMAYYISFLKTLSLKLNNHTVHFFYNEAKSSIRCFIKPTETLERSLEINKHKGKKRLQKRPNYKNVGEEEEEERGLEDTQEDQDKAKGTEGSSKGIKASGENEEIEMVIMERCKMSELSISTVTEQNTTDEEKSAAASGNEMINWSRPFLDMVYNAQDCTEDDYYALFVLCLLYAMSQNKGIDPVKLERIQLPAQHAEEKSSYNHVLAERLIRIMNYAAQPDGKVRLATLELGCLLLKQLVLSKSGSIIKDVHLACLEGAREESVHLLRHFYKGEEIFLDMFEDEYRSMTIKPMNVEYLMMDASILLPPTGTPLTGIDFVKRLPCGDVERTRRAIRVFFMLRSLSLHLRDEPETQLPLTREEDLIKTDDVLDLNNSDLIACTVITKDGGQVQRFLAVDIYQMSLVEPDVARLGWGVVKFAGLLQDMQVTGVEDDSRALNIIIHKPASSPHSKPFPILQATFIFSDHIRCIIAKQRLAKGRIQARRMKMQRIAALLDLPVQPSTEVMGFGHSSASTSQHLPFRFYDQSRRGSCDPTVQRSVFASVDKVPGFAVAQCINQHNPSPLSSPSPSSSGSGSTGHCDSVTASSTSTPSTAQSPSGLAGKDDGGCLVCRRLTVTVDTGFRSSSSSCNRNSCKINAVGDSSALEQLPMTFSSQVMLVDETSSAASKSGKNSVKNPEVETANLSPSLIPAQQPTISLISDDNTDALSVESLTLVPPIDPHSIHTFSCIPQSSLPSEVCRVTEGEGSDQSQQADYDEQ
ncbi:protein CLEC16A isoform X9 [Lepidochelys kempii]|uniref:protein CLEC16A isoform X9 n=1 Tax=Lepidochelys kempii TaxID=8472 RepID=UPI003C6F57EF